MSGPGPTVFAAAVCALCLVVAGGCGDDVVRPPAPLVCQAEMAFPVSWRPRYSPQYTPCSFIHEESMAASDGVVYYSSTDGLCAADENGVRVLVPTYSQDVSSVPARLLLIVGDRLLFSQGSELRSFPLAGGAVQDLVTFEDIYASHVGYDGSHVYIVDNGEDSQILRAAVSGGSPEHLLTVTDVKDSFGNVRESSRIEQAMASAGHVDFLRDAIHQGELRPLYRLEADTRVVRPLHPLGTVGALLAVDGDVSYVRGTIATKAPNHLSYDDVSLFRIDGQGTKTAVLGGGQLPPLWPTAASVAGDSIYVGASTRFAGNQHAAVVVAGSREGRGGEIVGCLPGPVGVDMMATDASGVYALLRKEDPQTGDGLVAVIRIPR